MQSIRSRIPGGEKAIIEKNQDAYFMTVLTTAVLS